MDSWEKFVENALPPKEAFYRNLNLEDISDEDYAHAQKLWHVFEINNLGDCHVLYVQSDTLLLADVYENFRNMCLEKYELDHTYFDGKRYGIRSGICRATHKYAKANKAGEEIIRTLCGNKSSKMDF